jgi:pimeloyl-ACP methyl ester carboxylesterase
MIKTDKLKMTDGCGIAYRHYDGGKKKVVVIVHGFYNSKDSELLSLLADRLSGEYDVFIFDLRGHGKSDGRFTWTTREEDDLGAVLEHLKARYQKVAVIGFSLGGTTSMNVLTSGGRKADSFICVSAPSDFDKVDYKWWLLDWENDIFYSLMTKGGRQGKGVRIGAWWLKKNKPIDNVTKLDIPVLYLHGDKDWVVGKWHSEELYAKTRSKKEIAIVENGPHAEYLIRKYPEMMFGKISGWLNETI